VGKARTFSDAARESIYQKEFDDEVYNTAAQQNSYNLGSVHFSDQSGIANITQAGTDQRKANLKGALFTGNIGFDLQTARLDVGTDTIDLLEDATSTALSLVSTDRIVTLSAGTTSDLVTILGSQRPGQRLTLYNISGNVITIKHTGAATPDTIRTPDNSDFIMQNTMAINLVYDITTTQWRIVGIAAGSGSGYDTIEDEGVALTQRTVMNFSGAGVVAVDNPGQSRTDITITGAATNEFPDDVFRVIGSADATKKLAFEVDGFTTVTTRTMTPPDTDTVLGGLSVSPQTWTGINTFTGSSFSVTSPNIFLGDETSDAISFGGRINTDFVPISNSDKNLGASGLQWNTLWIDTLQNATTVVINSPNFAINSSQITLGDANTDSISFLGRVGTDFVPIANSTHNLGTSGLQWNTLWIDTLDNASTVVVNSPNFAINSSQITLGDSSTDEISFLGRVSNNGIIPINNSSANLGASGLQWNTLWIDTLDNATTVVINSPNFAINSSRITLGDNSTDDITFLGQVDSNIVIEEIAEPGNAPANTGRFYAKESSGVSVPFWKDEVGTETSMVQTPWVTDIDAGTFDLFNLDRLTFKPSASTPFPLNVGFSSLGSGSFRGNVLNAGRFEWTEEDIELMRLSEASSITTLDLTGILSSQINLGETTTGKTGTILQGSTTLQYTTTGTEHEYLVGVESIAKITADGIQMQGSNFILTPQIGFSILGNIIQDDVNGMIFDTPLGDDFTWRDGTNTFATLDIDGLFLNQLFIQFTSITSPGVTGSANVGELFMDSGNSNHLSIIRNASVIDLEAAGGEVNTASNIGGGADVFAQKNGVDLEFRTLVGGTDIQIVQTATELTLNFNGTTGEVNTASNVGAGLGKVFKQKSGVDLEFKSILAGSNVEIVNGTDDVQINSTSDGIQDATPFVDPRSGNPLVAEDVYMSNSKQGLEISNTTTAQEDIMEYVPIYLGRTTNIDRLAWVKADAVSVGSISWTIGIYDSVHSSPNVGANYPADLIVSGSTTSDSTEGIKFIGISPTTLPPGLYWLGFLITNISTAATLVASARHETANANCVGYFINSAANDRLDNILSYVEGETTIPSTADPLMAIIGANPMAVFYRVNTVF